MHHLNHPVQALRDRVRLDAGKRRGARLAQQHQVVLCRACDEIIVRHVLQSVRLALPAAICAAVHDMLELTDLLVQRFRRRNHVVHHPQRITSVEVREIRDDGEVLVWAEVVVQAHLRRADHPAHAAHALLDQMHAMIQQPRHMLARVALDNAEVATGEHRDQRIGVFVVLLVDDAIAAGVIVLAVPAASHAVGRRHVVAEP